MENKTPDKWEKVAVRSSTLSPVRRYSELCGAPLSTLTTRALELWIKLELPALMKPFEGKD